MLSEIRKVLIACCDMLMFLYAETVRILLHGTGIKAKWQLTDANLNTPLHIFAEQGNLGAVRLLVEDGVSNS